MKTLSLILLVVCALFSGSTPRSTASSVADSNHGLSALTHQELALARRATAKYHDVEQAEADGYVDFNLFESGEGFHYIKFSLLDGTFDPAQPEILLYATVPGEDRLQLVGVEYLVPLALSSGPPSGFTGDADEWREDAEGFGLWEVNAWLWLHNPDGVFAHDNPRIP